MADGGHNRNAPLHAPRMRWFEIGALVAAAIVLVVFRFHAFDLPLETDECNYAYIGACLLAGDRLYVDVWDHQPPGVYVLFAGVIALFGDAPAVFRLLALAFSLVSLALIWQIVRRHAGPWGAIVAGLMFALASSDPGSAGEGCNREIYMNTCLLAAWWLVDVRRPRTRWSVLAAGVLLALASALKTIVAVHWVALAAWIMASELRSAPRSARAGRVLLYFAIGPLLVWAPTAAYFTITGRWSEYLDAVFLFNLSYAEGVVPFWNRFWAFVSPPRHQFIFDSALSLWVAGTLAVAAYAVLIVAGRCRCAAPILLYVAASYAAVCLPGHFWPHYYYLMIPPLVIVTAIALADICAYFSRRNAFRSVSNTMNDERRARAGARPSAQSPVRWGWAMLPACALVAWLGWTQWTYYLGQPPFGITVTRYNSRDFWGQAMGAKLGSVTEPEDTVFVFGNDAEIYYYANRHCASRFTMISGISAGHRGIDERRRLLLDDLQRNRPRVILLLFDQPPFPEWKAFLDEYYSDPVGWDLHDRTSDVIMFVLEDSRRPIERIDWNWDRSEVGGWFPGERR